MCEKEFSVSNFDQAVIVKMSIFQETFPNFTYSQKLYIFQSYWKFLDQLPLPYRLQTVAREEYSFSVLPVVRRFIAKPREDTKLNSHPFKFLESLLSSHVFFLLLH